MSPYNWSFFSRNWYVFVCKIVQNVNYTYLKGQKKKKKKEIANFMSRQIKKQ